MLNNREIFNPNNLAYLQVACEELLEEQGLNLTTTQSVQSWVENNQMKILQRSIELNFQMMLRIINNI